MVTKQEWHKKGAVVVYCDKERGVYGRLERAVVVFGNPLFNKPGRPFIPEFLPSA